MRLPFLPLGSGAHPLWWTCYSSPTAVRSATVMGKMLSGRYRSCWLRRHWTQESGACRLPGCGLVPGDVAHLLSGECPALQPHLAITLQHLYIMLAPYPHLLPPFMSALHGDRESVTTFFHQYTCYSACPDLWPGSCPGPLIPSCPGLGMVCS